MSDGDAIMKQGDFTNLAKNYIHRTGYSKNVLAKLSFSAKLNPSEIITADVGAGTGKLTENLIELGFKGFAVEPNDAMREEGIKLLGNYPFVWSKGTGENTGLLNSSVDWVLMGSSFHWTDSQKTLGEFHRILKPRGNFVVLWNPRDLEASSLHMEIENWIHAQFPQIRRVSSGGHRYMEDIDETLLEGGYFKDVIFMEDTHVVEMSKDRFIGAWKSVNDIRAQIGEENFHEVLRYISEKISTKSSILVPYKTRAWMVRAVNT